MAVPERTPDYVRRARPLLRDAMRELDGWSSTEHRGVSVSVSWRSPKDPIGRFGGGWQWKAGVQSTALRRRRGKVVLSVLVLEVVAEWNLDDR